MSEQLEAAWLEAASFEDAFELKEEPDLDSAMGICSFHFICQGILNKVGSKCLTLSSSSEYEQVGRHWYCPCRTRYRCTWGVLGQIKKGQYTFYMKAPEPPNRDILDMNPQHLSDLNHLVPTTEETIVPHELYPGSFRFHSEEEFDALPTYEWSDILHFAKGL